MNLKAVPLWPMDYLLLDSAVLDSIKAKYTGGDANIVKLVDRLRKAADRELKKGPYSVMNKQGIPPSGDRHDYMSLAIYYWPAGRKYVNRDGLENPDSKSGKYDKTAYDKMAEAVKTLALANFYTGNPDYSRKAAQLIKTWYLNPETRQNPNLNFGQSIPGKSNGRPEGLIETSRTAEIIDSAVMLYNNSKEFTAADMGSFKKWISDFHQWLLDSDIGQMEDKSMNNHGDWFDAQIIAYEIFTGEKDMAASRINNITKARIDAQVEPDGSLPRELMRTRPLHYSMFALCAFITAARLSEKAGVDLWNYKTGDGRGIKSALDYLMPYIDGSRSFLKNDIAPENESYSYAVMLICAASEYHDGNYLKAADKLLEHAGPRGEYIDLMYNRKALLPN